MKKTIMVIICIVAALFILAIAKDLIIKVSVEKGVEFITGIPLKMQGFRAGILRTIIDIKNLKLLNPAGYKDKVMIDMPQVYIHYNLPAILGGKVHLRSARIDLKEFNVIKNEKGELNLNALKVVKAQKEKKAPSDADKGKAPQIQIDSLHLKIGKVVYKDYSRPGAPSVREFNINLDEAYSDIRDPYSLVSLIVFKSLVNTNIANLTNFDLGAMKGSIGDTLATAQRVSAEAVAKAKVVTAQATQTVTKVRETAAQTQETVKKTADAFKDAFGNPFGGSK